MQLDTRLTTIIPAGVVVLLLLAAMQSPVAQSTGTPMMQLGSVYSLSLGTTENEINDFLAITFNETTGTELSGLARNTDQFIQWDGSGELFVVENTGSGLGGVVQGTTVSQPGSFYNYTEVSWYNTTGDVFYDNSSDPVDGVFSSFSKDFTATYNDTYVLLFDGFFFDVLPIDIIPRIYSGVPYLGFNLGEQLLDMNMTTIPNTQIIVSNITLPWNGQNSTFTSVESFYDLVFDFVNIPAILDIPGAYGDYYLLNVSGNVGYNLAALYNQTNGMLEAFMESFSISIYVIGRSDPSSASSLQLQTGSTATNITTYYSWTSTTMANVTGANFGPGNPMPSIDSNYPFDYGDDIVYSVDDYYAGYLTSSILDATGTTIDVLEGIYSESAMGQMQLRFAYTDSGLALSSLLDQAFTGYATYGVIYTGERIVDGVENHGFLANNTFFWDNGTSYQDSFMELGYDKLEVAYNATHPIIGEFRSYIELFEDYDPGEFPFSEFINNNTIPLTSLTSYTYNLPIDINNNTNMYLDAVELIAFYDRNWTDTIVNYEVPGLDGLFNLTISIYFWYSEYYTYDAAEGMLLLANQFAGIGVNATGPGYLMIPGQTSPTNVTLDLNFTLTHELERALTTVPYYYPYTPPTTTTPTSTTTTTTSSTQPTNTSTPTPTPTPTSPGGPTFLPGFEIYVSAAAIFVPVALTVLRRKR